MAVYESKTATKDGRKWYFSVKYIKVNGVKDRNKSKKFATEKQAQTAEIQFLVDNKIQQEVGNTNPKIDITFEEMYSKYLSYTDTEKRIKGSSKYSKISRIKNHILPHFGKINIHDITVNVIIDWKSIINQATYSKDRKYSLKYKRALISEFRTALNYGVEFCGLKENVAKIVSNFHDKSETVIADEEKIRYITPVEYNLFASVIDKIVYKVFFAFLYYMGVRKGEAQALFWEDILWNTNQVRIIKTVTTKTDERDEYGNRFKITNTKNRKNRTIKMPIILKNLLLELYQHYKELEGFNEKWFVFGGNRHLASQSIDNVKDSSFKLVKEKYGIEINRITNHEFRHSHASYLISKGVKVELIAYRLGDTVAVVLETYAHLFPEVEDVIIEELDLIEDNYNIDLNLINSSMKKEFFKSPAATKNPLFS
ncbi:MAG: site-specific integrase [Oscillospiraceae bacterium]|nr:site-specific integrase [Oscillospiraceae bacterium]